MRAESREQVSRVVARTETIGLNVGISAGPSSVVLSCCRPVRVAKLLRNIRRLDAPDQELAGERVPKVLQMYVDDSTSDPNCLE